VARQGVARCRYGKARLGKAWRGKGANGPSSGITPGCGFTHRWGTCTVAFALRFVSSGVKPDVDFNMHADDVGQADGVEVSSGTAPDVDCNTTFLVQAEDV
jgi:hypothetical protein